MKGFWEKAAITAVVFAFISIQNIRDSVAAPSVPAMADHFCKMSRYDFRKKLLKSDNQMGFENPPGSLGTGLCWWHSRFQRQANYLTVFNPLAKKPNGADVDRMISKIIGMNEVVEIPGYSNLKDFTKANASQITDALSKWEVTGNIPGLTRSSPFGFDILNGVRPDDLTPKWTEYELNRAYTFLGDTDLIPYVTVKYSNAPAGFAHSWLIQEMIRKNNGYEIHYLDSNYPGQILADFFTVSDDGSGLVEIGKRPDSYWGNAFLYPQRNDDFSLLLRAMQNYCEQNGYSNPKFLTDAR